MESAFGVEHGEVSKGVGTLLKTGYKSMSTGEKLAYGGTSVAAGAAVGVANKKRTGRFSGNGGLVGLGARKAGLGYQKRSV